MSDLETKLDMARNSPRPKDAPDYFEIGFDACAAIAREAIAEKDAEILRLKRELDRRPFLEPDEHIGKDSEVIAREAEIARLGAVVAEKDAEIERLEQERDMWRRTAEGESAAIARLEASRLDNSTWLLADKPRKVTDAQREAIHEALSLWWGDEYDTLGASDKRLMDRIIAIIESTDEPAAK
jgi:hypothetical protein